MRLLIFLVCLPFLNAFSQGHGFPFGKVTYADLGMDRYDKDTTAGAVVLDEFGEAYIDQGGNNNLIFEFHRKIKIIKPSGLDMANVSIPLWKDGERVEFIHQIEASSFTLENNRIIETKVLPKSILTVKENENLTWNKFAIPNVRPGSVIEYKYTLESPFVFNFRPWFFQDELPKLKSEYWATIPANYEYNISLKGFLKLGKNDTELVKDCFEPGGGNKADCSRLMFGMKDIPAFVDEEFMAASKNYISSIEFELSAIKHFDGRVDKVTRDWKDVEEELRRNPKFGVQLKRGKDLADVIEPLVQGKPDDMAKARTVYAFIKNWFVWDGEFSKYCENGIRKSFDKKKGNVGDINLSLVTALRAAGLEANPVILSTRSNGMVHELFPVLSDFNYVVAKLELGNKIWLLDATDPALPFGMLPRRCLNGKGRELGDKTSAWIDLKPTDKSKRTTLLNLKIEEDGKLRGTWQNIYIGYDAFDRRKSIASFQGIEEYFKDWDAKLENVSIKKSSVDNLLDDGKPLIETMEVEVEAFDEVNKEMSLFNPYFIQQWKENPFKSSERIYPVDFTVPLDQVFSLTLNIHPAYVLENIPTNVALALPNQGGKFFMSANLLDKTLTLSNSLNLSKTLFSPEEYHYLKELFGRIIQVQETPLVIKRKK